MCLVGVSLLVRLGGCFVGYISISESSLRTKHYGVLPSGLYLDSSWS